MMSSAHKSHTQAAESAPTWDLEPIFAGGSSSQAFADFRKRIREDLKAAESRLDSLPRNVDEGAIESWRDFVVAIQDLAARISTAGSFAGCLTAADVNDDRAHAISSEMDSLTARLRGLQTGLESFSVQISDADWERLVDHPPLHAIRFYLDELRTRARGKMAPELERLAQELAVDGYHAWNRLYDKMAGDLRVTFPVHGEEKEISLGQLVMYLSNSRRDIRHEAFTKLEAAWETRANLAAMALNAQGGFRLSLYRNRRWDSALYEPLQIGRLKRETLEAMWASVTAAVPRLVPYIEAKKKLLRIEKFCWYDQGAPAGASDRVWDFDEAGRFIVNQLGDFSGEMAEFSAMALDQRWVEAENRPGKGGGGFCTGFPTHRATRIFMTWGGEYDHLMTLAHELGHSYHSWVLREKPYFATRYPMNLAETASTFNELRVTDAALRSASEHGERLMLLDQKLQNAHVMFCNLRARYLFDVAFYEERAEGVVPRARLDELMVAAQREAFGGTLSDPEGFHPLFWASKLHFFITSYPFYNWPYVYGFLFANGVYHHAQVEGSDFALRYRDLLADTGSMRSEEIAQKHLGVDLTRSDFWDAAVERILADVEPFVKLAAQTG